MRLVSYDIVNFVFTPIQQIHSLQYDTSSRQTCVINTIQDVGAIYLRMSTMLLLIAACLVVTTVNGESIAIGQYKKQLLDVHNAYRGMQGASDMQALVRTCMHTYVPQTCQSSLFLFFFFFCYQFKKNPHCSLCFKVWDDQLSSEAANWIKRCQFEHEKKGRGENLAFDSNPKKDEELINSSMKAWYDEIKDYNYARKACGRSCHYTQVYKDTHFDF